MCWWEDEGLEPWEVSGPNGQTLLAAQIEFLAETRPFRARPGEVRAPKRQEARDPDWRPLELSDELLARAERSKTAYRQEVDDGRRRLEQEIAADPEGSFKEYNAAARSLKEKAAALSHRERKAKLSELSRTHGMPFTGAHVELFSRLMKDENFYRHHPVRVAWWLLRYARPRTFRRRWAEVRTGEIHFASVRGL